MADGPNPTSTHDRPKLPVGPLKVTPAQLARAKRWSIGQRVTVTQYYGTQIDTATRTGPWKANGVWWILVVGFAGSVALAHVTERCDHKFVDSTSCLKCGWTPETRA